VTGKAQVAFASRVKRRLTIGRRLTGRILLIGALLTSGLFAAPARPADRDDGSLVETKNGLVKGFVENGTHKFLGIPYAAPPVGSLRWLPPQPHAAWLKPLEATAFGNTCPQNNELAVFAGPPSATEDCLYLNVFTTNVARRGRSPVLLWIHGGGWFDGESNDYDARWWPPRRPSWSAAIRRASETIPGRATQPARRSIWR